MSYGHLTSVVMYSLTPRSLERNMLSILLVMLASGWVADASWYITKGVDPISGTFQTAWAWRNSDTNADLWALRWGAHKISLKNYAISGNCRLFCNNVRPTTRCWRTCPESQSRCHACNGIMKNCHSVCNESQANCQNICRGNSCRRVCGAIRVGDKCRVACTRAGGCRRVCDIGIRQPLTLGTLPTSCGIVCNERGECRRTCDTSVTSSCMTVCDVSGRCRRVCGCRINCNARGLCHRVCNGGYTTSCKNVCTGGQCRVYCGPESSSTLTNNCRYVCGSDRKCRLYCGRVTTPEPSNCIKRCDLSGRCWLQCSQVVTVRPMCCLPQTGCTQVCGSSGNGYNRINRPDCRMVCDHTGCHQVCTGGTDCQITCNRLGCVQVCGSTRRGCRVVCGGVDSSVMNARCQTTCNNGRGDTYKCGNGCKGIPWLTSSCQPSCNTGNGIRCETACNRNCRIVCDNTQKNLVQLYPCVDQADQGDCAYYRCFIERWRCSNDDFIRQVALPFCERENAKSPSFGTTASKYMKMTRICRMRALMPTFVAGKATCPELSTQASAIVFGKADGENCYWMAGRFCSVISSRRNIDVLFDIYSGRGIAERRYVELFWKLAQRCDKSSCDLFYQAYVVRFTSQYGAGGWVPAARTRLPLNDMCRRYLIASDCRFYTQCPNNIGICTNQYDSLIDAGWTYCQKTNVYLNSFNERGLSYIRAVRRCEMEKVALLFTSDIRSCRERNAASDRIFFTTSPDTHCFWQNALMCDVMSERINLDAIVRLYVVGRSDATQQRYKNVLTSLAARCSAQTQDAFISAATWHTTQARYR